MKPSAALPPQTLANAEGAYPSSIWLEVVADPAGTALGA